MTRLLLGCTLLAMMLPLFAASQEYDATRPATLAGKLVKFIPEEPLRSRLAWMHVEVTEKNGSKTIWEVELNRMTTYARDGWTRAAIEALVGQTATVEGYLAKDGRKRLTASSLTTEKGATFKVGVAAPK